MFVFEPQIKEYKLMIFFFYYCQHATTRWRWQKMWRGSARRVFGVSLGNAILNPFTPTQHLHSGMYVCVCVSVLLRARNNCERINRLMDGTLSLMGSALCTSDAIFPHYIIHQVRKCERAKRSMFCLRQSKLDAIECESKREVFARK